MLTAQSYFITGTDTGIGKTRVALELMRDFQARGYRVAGMKPVASGCTSHPEGPRNEDALALQALCSTPADYVDVNPVSLLAPVAPVIAATGENRSIDLAVIMESYKRLGESSDLVIVEGVGGWKIHLGKNIMLADLVRALELPVILVVGMKLGCINHALLTCDAIRRDGIELAGWVANAPETGTLCVDDMLALLSRDMPAPLLARMQYAEPGETAQLRWLV